MNNYLTIQRSSADPKQSMPGVLRGNISVECKKKSLSPTIIQTLLKIGVSIGIFVWFCRKNVFFVEFGIEIKRFYWKISNIINLKSFSRFMKYYYPPLPRKCFFVMRIWCNGTCTPIATMTTLPVHQVFLDLLFTSIHQYCCTFLSSLGFFWFVERLSLSIVTVYRLTKKKSSWTLL